MSSRLITAVAASVIIAQSPSALALSSTATDHPWNPQHIAQLPNEIRSALARRCGNELAAQHYFAGYFDNARIVVLNFGLLRCGDRAAFCVQGKCLHQVYGLQNARYRLVREYYGND
jgi:hypothetical protein